MNKRAKKTLRLGQPDDYKDICKKCWGKGYATYFYGITGAEDLDLKAWEKPKEVHIEYCACNRGKQLHAMVKKKQAEAQKLITKRIYNSLKGNDVNGFIKIEALKKILQGYYEALQKDKPILKVIV